MPYPYDDYGSSSQEESTTELLTTDELLRQILARKRHQSPTDELLAKIIAESKERQRLLSRAEAYNKTGESDSPDEVVKMVKEIAPLAAIEAEHKKNAAKFYEYCRTYRGDDEGASRRVRGYTENPLWDRLYELLHPPPKPAEFEPPHDHKFLDKKLGLGFINSLASGMYKGFSKGLGTLDWISAQMGSPMQREYLKQRPSPVKKAADWMAKQGEAVGLEGLPEGSFGRGLYEGLGEMGVGILGLKGLGATGLGFAALPVMGAAEGGKEGGLAGAAQGAAMGALVGGRYHALSKLPAVMKAPLAFVSGAALASGTTADRLVGGTTDVLMTMGHSPTVRQFFDKPLGTLTKNEAATLENYRQRIDAITTGASVPKEGAYETVEQANVRAKLVKPPVAIKDTRSGKVYKGLLGDIHGDVQNKYKIGTDFAIPGWITRDGKFTENMGEASRSMNEPIVTSQKDTVDLFHFTRSNEVKNTRIVDPAFMGTGSIGAEKGQMLPGGKMTPGNLPKSNWYSRTSPTIEPHKWVGADVYKVSVPKSKLMIIPKGGGIPKGIDTIAQKAGKIGWFDETTGQARLIEPIEATRYGKSITKKGPGVSGKDIDTVIERSIKSTGVTPPIKPFVIDKDLGDRLKQATDKAFEAHMSDPMNPGSTVNIDRGNLLGKRAYAVSIYNERSKIIKGPVVLRSILEEFAKKNADLLSDSRNSIGTYYDRGDGNTYIDVVVTLPDRGISELLGKRANQRSIFGLEKAEVIETGGDGKNLENLGPVEGRLDRLLKEVSPTGAGAVEPTESSDMVTYLSGRKAMLNRNEKKVLELLKKGKITQADAKILSIVQEPDIWSLFKRKPREVLLALEEQIIDEWAPLRNAVRQFEDLSGKVLTFEQNFYKQVRMYPGRLGLMEEATGELRDLLAPVRKLRSEFKEYGIAERASERWARNIDNPEYQKGKPITEIEARQARESIAAKVGPENYKKIQDVTAQFYQWSDKWIMQNLRDAGVISKELYNAVKSGNKKWFPFEAMKYVDETFENVPTGSKFLSMTAQTLVKPMTGGLGKIVPPFESVINTLQKSITMAEKNRIMNVFVNARDLSPEIANMIVPIKTSAALASPAEFGDIKVLQDGILKRYMVPKEIADTFKNMDRGSADYFVKIMQTSSTLFRAGTTAWYLPFSLGNAPRDFKLAVLASRSGFNIVNWTQGLAHGLAHSFGFDTKLFKAYLHSRGAFANLLAKTPRRSERKLFESRTRELATEGIKFIKNFAQAVELAPRIGVFQRSRGKGFAFPGINTRPGVPFKERFTTAKRTWVAGSDIEAGFASRNSTIDFSRGGHLLKAFNRVAPFINARAQAKVVLWDATFRNQRTVEAITKAISWVVVPSLSMYFYNTLHHRTTWDEIPEYVKDNYDVVVLGTKKDEKGRSVPDYIKLAKGDVEQVIINPLITFLEWQHHKDPQVIQRLAINFLSDVSPIAFAREGKPSWSKALAGGIPPMFRAPIEYALGKSLYTEQETVPYSLKKIRPEDQFNEKTSILYKTLGKATGGSPMKLQALAKGLFGSIAENPTPAGQIKAITGRVRGTTGGVSLERAYKIQKKAEQGYFTARKDMREAIAKGKGYEVSKIRSRWERDFYTLLRDMSRLTGQGFQELFQTPFYKMYSFQDKDIESIKRGLEEERVSLSSGLEEKLGYDFYKKKY